jgi:hypothetical protein
MPGNLTISATNNAGQSIARSRTAASDAQFDRFSAYLAARFGKNEDGSDRNQAQTFDAFAQLYLGQIILDLKAWEQQEAARAAVGNVAEPDFG